MSKAIKSTPILYNREAREFIKRTELNSKKSVSHEVIKEIREGANRLKSIFVKN